MVPFEVLLVLGVVGFYVYDSAQLLYANEMVFRVSDVKWSFVYPGSNWRLLGKNLYVPNPLTPSKPEFPVYWSAFEKIDGSHDQQELDLFLHALVALQHGVIFLSFFLLVVLPSVALFYGTGAVLGIVFAFIYLSIFVLLILAYRRRSALRVTKKQFFSLALESILCAPFALNIVRKICRQFPLKGDPIDFGCSMFEESTFRHLLDTITEKVDEKLGVEEPQGGRYLALQSYKNKILTTKS